MTAEDRAAFVQEDYWYCEMSFDVNPVSVNAFIEAITNSIIVNVLVVLYKLVNRTTRD